MRAILLSLFLIVPLLSFSQNVKVDEFTALFLGRHINDIKGLRASNNGDGTYYDASSIYKFNKQMRLYSLSYVGEGWIDTQESKSFYETVFNLYSEILINLGKPDESDDSKKGQISYVWHGVRSSIQVVSIPQSFIVSVFFYDHTLAKYK